MAVAPEPYLSACLAVLSRAIRLAQKQSCEAEMIGDVALAVHDIPDLIKNWEQAEELRLRLFLQACDAKWPTGLYAAYTFTLERRVV